MGTAIKIDGKIGQKIVVEKSMPHRYPTRFQAKLQNVIQKPMVEIQKPVAEIQKPMTPEIQKDIQYIKSILDKTHLVHNREEKTQHSIELFLYLSEHSGLLHHSSRFHETVVNKIKEFQKIIKEERIKLLIQEEQFSFHESNYYTVHSIIKQAKYVGLLDHLELIISRVQL